MDPLSTFTRTSRKIQLAFDVPSEDAGSAANNLQRVNKLITFLYPLYDKQDGTDGQRVGHTLSAAPLIELKWTNLIADPGDNSGLIGYLDGVNYAPKIADGGFGRAGGGNFQEGILDQAGGFSNAALYSTSQEAEARRIAAQTYARITTETTLGSVDKSNIYIPKTLSISLSFTVLHKHLPGWVQTTTPSGRATNEYIFGNRQVNGGFPNTQKGHRDPAALMNSTTTVDSLAGTTTTTTQITSAFGTQILQSNK